MATSSNVKAPYVQFYDIDGQPLEDGYIYIGTAGLDPSTNAQTVYSDADLSTSVTQPVRTIGGFPVFSGSPIRLYTAGGDFSLRVSNKNNSTIHQDLNVADDRFGLDTLFIDNANSRIGVKSTADLGSGIHVKTADSAGAVSADADELVLEGSGNTGLTVLSGATSAGALFFADSGANDVGGLLYDHSGDLLSLRAGGSSVVEANSTFFRPNSDNTIDCGGASNRWEEVFSATGTINTSDAREKTLYDNPDQEKALDAIDSVRIACYKWNSAIEQKGEEGARIHYGAVAQEIKAAFEAQGLDPFAYGVLCYDEWDAEYKQVIDQPAVFEQILQPDGTFKDGDLISPATLKDGEIIKEAGNRYGVRYEELLALKVACLERKIASL